MKSYLRATLRVAEGGRIVIPLEVRRRLGLDVGADLVMTVEDDRATIMNAKAARRRARQRVRQYVEPGASLSEDLLAERKKEAERE
jgi:bifunctional DNA-binding transcriptional regulator/antitoxin component of YhaV-PrlF toxin-antitoxin module